MTGERNTHEKLKTGPAITHYSCAFRGSMPAKPHADCVAGQADLKFVATEDVQLLDGKKGVMRCCRFTPFVPPELPRLL